MLQLAVVSFLSVEFTLQLWCWRIIKLWCIWRMMCWWCRRYIYTYANNRTKYIVLLMWIHWIMSDAYIPHEWKKHASRSQFDTLRMENNGKSFHFATTQASILFRSCQFSMKLSDFGVRPVVNVNLFLLTIVPVCRNCNNFAKKKKYKLYIENTP